jgi:hypothetical protein
MNIFARIIDRIIAERFCDKHSETTRGIEAGTLNLQIPAGLEFYEPTVRNLQDWISTGPQVI